MAEYIRLLRNNPGFTLLWSAQVISLLGDWFNTIVLSTLVARYSGGSGIAIGGYLMARFLPPLIFGPFAGVLVDRFDRKKILIYSNVSRTGVVLLFLLANSPDRLWIIYVLTIIQFAISSLFEPGQSAIIPSLVKRDDLVIANTLTSVTWSVMLALGAIIGGVVGAIFGSAIALITDAITFAVAGYLIHRIDLSNVPPKSAIIVDDSQEPETGSLLEGIRYVIRNPSIAAVLMVKGGTSLGNVDTLMTIYATEIFILGTNGQLSLGIMYSAFGVGAFAGPIALNRFHNGSIMKMVSLIAIGFILAGIGWIVLGASSTLLLLSIGLFVRAMGGSVNWTYSSVILQKTVPDRFLGRVFALDMASFQLSTVVSILVHGAIIDLIRRQVTQADPMLNLYRSTALDNLLQLNNTLTTVDLQALAFGTGLVSILPLAIWMALMPRMKRKFTNTENEENKNTELYESGASL